MATSKEEPPKSIEPSKALVAAGKTEDVQKDLVSTIGSAPVAPTSLSKLTYGGLPAFHLPAEGLGGKKLAAVWVT